MPILSKTTPVMFRYPDLGDNKPKPDHEVMLIKNDGQHVRGIWNDATCKAWAELHASERKKPKPNSLPLNFKEPA
jgi:hypothetical protein